MADHVLTLEEIEERLDEITNQPEKYIRDQKGNLIEANTSIVKAMGTTAFLTEQQNVDLSYRHTKLTGGVRTDKYRLADISDKFRAAQGSFWVDENPTRQEMSSDRNNLIFLSKERPNL